MKVLVTGATGFTGGRLARALHDRGHTVRGLVRESSDAGALVEAGIEIAAGDVRDSDAVERAVEGVDQVYHIAAAWQIAGQPDRYYRDVNVGGTRNILDAARRSGVERVIHCSTMGVHGHVKHPPADEASPFGPGDIYQRTKLEAELLATEAFASGLRGVVFRPGAIYGPGDGRFLKLFRAVRRRRFVMLGSGRVHYHMVYIDDLISGILLCGSKEEALGNVYLLNGPQAITLNELVRLVAEAVGAPCPRLRLPLWPVWAASWLCEAACKPFRIHPPIYPRRVDFFRKERSFKIDKARRELGYSPAVGPASGIGRTAEWYVDQGLLAAPAARGDVTTE